MQIGILMTPGIAWIRSDDTVQHAASLMRGAMVGALAVFESDRLAGIITERDLMAAVADGVDPGRVLAAERMTPAPRTIAHDDLATRAAELMIELGVRHLPVVDHGDVVGVISARDLLRLGRPKPLEELAYEPW